MTYQEHPAPRTLAASVECFWTAQRSQACRILPDGCVDILFDLHGGPARIAGVMTRAIVTPGGSSSAWLGVRFRAGSALEMLGLSARETRDVMPSLRDVWGAAGRELEQRVQDANTHAGRIAIVTSCLVEQGGRGAAQDVRVARAVHAITQARGLLAVSSLARKLSIGERKLERLFDEHVGIGPKLLARVVRMQHAANRLRRAPMAALARDCGYADQSHMIRDFQSLTGLSPALLLRERALSDSSNPVGTAPVNLTTAHSNQETAP